MFYKESERTKTTMVRIKRPPLAILPLKYVCKRNIFAYICIAALLLMFSCCKSPIVHLELHVESLITLNINIKK